MSGKCICRAASALAVKEDEPTEFLQLTIGHESKGWVVISDEEWPQSSEPAFEALFGVIKDLVDLNDPRVNSILENHSVRFQEPPRRLET